MTTAVRVSDLGKSYRVQHAGQRAKYRTLRESLADLAKAPVRRLRGDDSGVRSEEFWALKGVEFEVQSGEVVGIIGRNGAGKSTLLKILSRITMPTTGRVELYGRVGSLLEVGTGFHPELTGRENIYLNGSILGMSRREIDRRFDEIVAFAEVEKFLDTPVKHYSSGMYVRLAFAVAAHLEPGILLVDEVLAVGDAQFQKKCLGKMEDFSTSGRTVFFVSHQMSAVQRLCRQVILLEEGRLTAQGTRDEIIPKYLLSGPNAFSPSDWIDVSDMRRSGSCEARFVAMHFSSNNALTANRPYPDGPLEVLLEVESDVPRTISSLAVTFFDRYGTKLVNADTLSGNKSISLGKGRNEIVLRIEQLHLTPGTYSIGLWMANGSHVFDLVTESVQVEVVDPPGEGFGRRPPCDGAVTCNFSVERH